MSNDNNAMRRTITAPVVIHHGPSVLKVLTVGAACSFSNGTVVAVIIAISVVLGARLPDQQATAAPVEKETVVEEVAKEFDLTNDSIGMDESVQLNYNNDNIQEVSVPGAVDVTQAVGVTGAPEAPPSNVPAPAGSGSGTGGAPIDLNQLGGGQAFGSAGGMGGPGGGGFAGRSGSTRKKMLAEGGGNAASEAAVASGLKWLALHQFADGHWGLHDFPKAARTKPIPAGKVEGDNSTPNTTRKNDTAGTAFGLLPFLAGGITHKTTSKKENDYSKTVGAGLRWMIAKQIKSGADKGCYSNNADMYSHGIATIAMCEAYGLTSDPTLKTSAQWALDFIVRAQHEGGGWRYQPRQAGDTSVTGWQLMALKSGQMAGLTVPKSAIKHVEKYLNSCQPRQDYDQDYASRMKLLPTGHYGYTDSNAGSIAMTAVGALCREYLGVNPLNPSLLASVKKIKASPPTANAGIYYEYYATQVLHHMGGEHWQEWNVGKDGKSGIRDVLIRRQITTGANAGSFDGNDHAGGRLGATSLSLLTLEVYYRHLPLYRRDAGMEKPDDK